MTYFQLLARSLTLVGAGLLSACSTSNPLQQRLDAEREARIEQQEEMLQQAPDWYTAPPANREDILYAAGTYASTNWDLAERTATDLALGKVCIALQGQVNQVGRVQQRDIDGFAHESSETIIRNQCVDTKVSGYSIDQKHHYTDAKGRLRVFVLVAYPIPQAADRMPWPPAEEPEAALPSQFRTARHIWSAR